MGVGVYGYIYISIVFIVRYTLCRSISGEDVCFSVVFGTLVVVCVFSVMWYELLMTYIISWPVVNSVRVPESGVCVHISGED